MKKILLRRSPCKFDYLQLMFFIAVWFIKRALLASQLRYLNKASNGMLHNNSLLDQIWVGMESDRVMVSFEKKKVPRWVLEQQVSTNKERRTPWSEWICNLATKLNTQLFVPQQSGYKVYLVATSKRLAFRDFHNDRYPKVIRLRYVVE